MALPVPLIMAALNMVPDAIKYFRGDKGEKQAEIAGKIIGAAKVLTGQEDPAAAIDAVKNNPELLVKLQEQGKDIILAELAAETEQHRQTNETIRSELVSGDLFKSGWRPFFGWCVTPIFGLWILATTAIPVYMILTHPDKAGEIITLTVSYVSAMMLIWAAAFAVLGINISQRSRDKQVAAGFAPPAGLLGLLARR